MVIDYPASLSSFFPNAAKQGQGIFSEMVSSGAPWTTLVGLDMDRLYFGWYSGVKGASDIVSTFSTDGIADRETLARMLFNMYGTAWANLWNVMLAKYEPLQTYSLTEEISRNENRTSDYTRDDTGSSTYSDEGTNTSEDKGGGTVTVTVVGTGTASQYGFNSSEAVPTSSDTSNSTNTTENDTTDTVTGSTTDSGNSSSTLERKDKGTEDIVEGITRTRSGNTGQHTTQELLRQEFNLWKWNFYRQVFDDVDKVLCLSLFC